MRTPTTTFVLALALGSLGLYACDDNSSVKEPGATSSGGTSGGTSGSVDSDGGADCFTNPKTHFEIINACTDATAIEKNPALPRLLPDGGLPPLQ